MTIERNEKKPTTIVRRKGEKTVIQFEPGMLVDNEMVITVVSVTATAVTFEIEPSESIKRILKQDN